MGGRTSKRGAGVVRRVVPGVVGIALALASAPGPAADPALPAVTLRITWGGGKPAAHAGRIEFTGPGTEIEWRLLSSEPGATSTMHDASGAIEIHEPRPLDRNGVEVRVSEWRRARVRVSLAGRESGADPVVLEAAVSDLLVAPLQQPLDRDGNKISVGRAPGDELRVEFTAGETAVRRPGETVILHVHPLLPARTSPTASYELLVRGRRPGGGTESHRQALPVEPVPPDGSGVCEFQPLRVAVPLPTDEGGYDIELELVERGGLRWSRPVTARTIGMVAVAADRPTPPPAEWTLAYELDPGSPKLLERLRRLPGMGLPSLPTAGVTLPKLPRPSFALPKVPLPSVPLPTMPLPNVPFPSMPVPKLPAVNALVPRMTGLLAVGHSTLEIHDVGPLLKLPPAGAGPAWEGVALPASEPGMPQLVEIEYPLDQSMTLGLVVLEESDGDVRATATSGIHLSAPVIDDGSRAGRVGTRRFVFHPRTRSPLLVIANMSTRAPALFGRVRVLAGPSVVATRGPSPTVGRRTYLQIEVPDFIPFGAAGRAGADWDAFLGGIRRSADWALAQGAAGALVGVYADGAALWPTARTLQAPRWGIGGAFDGGLDPAPKDLLGLLGEVYGREQLRLVPALVCDGPLPAIDGLIAAGDAAGLVAVGRDGAAIAVDGGGCPHYNILDPRVQAEVEGLVAEVAGRLRGRSAVDGVAMVLPHDGWLHLPGVAAGLDDVTFARFVAESGAGVEPLARPALGSVDGRRFAARAALVEGPLRDAWLSWREAAVASFHTRLADVLVAADPQWSLYVMPTTLFAAGRFAERFRPQLAAESADLDVTREAGLDPARLTAHAAIVYAAPHVHDVADDVGGRGSVRQVNRSLALMRATAGAARAAAVLVERPHALDLRDPVSQSSFGSAPAPPVAVVAPVGGAEVRRGLAEALVAADVEAVFDAGLVHACIDETEERCREAVAALPAARLDVVASTPAPLVVRSRQGETGLWVSIVNAGGAACVAALDAAGTPTSVVDAVLKTALPLGPSGEVAVPMAPWEAKVVVLEGSERIARVRVAYEPPIAAAVTALLDDLQARRGALEMPAPLAVLDNPSFELPDHGGLVPGWELVETGRGRLRRVPGKPSAGGQGLEFASDHGLATMRSNPFAAPATGRISVAVWMRAAGASPQPPLRIALEGVQDDREFYRFAPVGLGPGAKPLSSAWSQFVLQIDDLPAHSLESLRVRLDLLGPGAVEFDDVRVFDLAFDESQRVRLSKILAVAAERSAAGDVGGCLVELDGPWPWFLREHVEPPRAVAAGQAEDPGAKLPARSGVVDRVRRWWQ